MARLMTTMPNAKLFISSDTSNKKTTKTKTNQNKKEKKKLRQKLRVAINKQSAVAHGYINLFNVKLCLLLLLKQPQGNLILQPH